MAFQSRLQVALAAAHTAVDPDASKTAAMHIPICRLAIPVAEGGVSGVGRAGSCVE
eukprot:CAMPEP_0197936964 /NCGR_PEP_ID=MMETSP1439-20131203/115789_1 /TAXON_ID=66791 /ORGANISM="Gonyaulax spinifera, Strain CCMP409" /LENGTH=55 /DNA_ID=CAMNT_0043559961 /DNA_START=31 /DNA_END=196 /DNA_ORIENTATION=+